MTTTTTTQTEAERNNEYIDQLQAQIDAALGKIEDAEKMLAKARQEIGKVGEYLNDLRQD